MEKTETTAPEAKEAEGQQQSPAVRSDTVSVKTSRRRPFAALAIILIVVLAIGFIVDTVQHSGKAYSGITVGGMDVAGLGSDEIIELLSAKYEPIIHAGPVRAYASQEALEGQYENASIDDFTTVEEEHEATYVWQTDAEGVDARIDYEDAADQAINLGRSSPLERLGLLIENKDIPLSIDCNNTLIDDFASQIDNVIGYPYQDCMVVMNGTEPVVIEGHDGDMVDREWLESTICEFLMDDTGAERSFVAETVYHPLEVDYEEAEECASTISSAIAQGVDIKYGDETWHADTAKLAQWICAETAQSQSGATSLKPIINPSRARNSILVHTMSGLQQGTDKVRIDENGGKVYVSIDSKGKMPDVDKAIQALNETLFGTEAGSAAVHEGATPSIQMDYIDVPDEMTFDEAVEKGVIAPISQYTTEYTYGATERNHNIHLAADLIDMSIVKGGGAEWSFNGIAGDCSEERGFQAAKAISGDETVDEIGGGICQVATTVFNAAYEAGFDITQRSNHSLYIPTYPAGRDSAVSYPDLDLKWRNDTYSDCILVMAYDDTTITATIYGIDPGYTVETETGDWVEGAKSQTIYKYDENVAAGVEYVETGGSDGRSIQVFRKVTDMDGKVVHEDQFYSLYNAQNTVIVRGGNAGNYQEVTSAA